MDTHTRRAGRFAPRQHTTIRRVGGAHSMTRLRSLVWLGAVAAAVAAVSSTDALGHRDDIGRVHAARASETVLASLVCPLGEGFDVPLVLLPCPYACGSDGSDGSDDNDGSDGSGTTGAHACVMYPSNSTAFCSGNCVYGDTCAFQCVTPPRTRAWSLRVDATQTSALNVGDEMNGTMAVDSTVVQALRILDGYALPSELQVILIRGDHATNETETFHVPADFFDRVGRQATSVVLENVALDEQIDSSGASFSTLRELRVVHSSLSTCPVELSRLSNLSLLDLSHNILRTFNGSELLRLTELYLGGNLIQELPVGSLPSQLETLDLSNNALVRFPDGITSLPHLRNLTLDGNAIRSLPNSTFSVSSPIMNLSLRNTSLTAVPSSIALLTKLAVLRLDNNDLSKVSASAFARFAKTLTNLSVNGANLRRIPTDLTNHLKLSSLSLASNNFSASSPIDCASLPKSLTRLNLSWSHVGLVPSGLTNLSILASLDLSGNVFDDHRVDASRFPTSVISLYLNNCSLTKPPTNLARLPTLHTLSLLNNPIEGEIPVNEIPAVTTLLLDGTSIASIGSFPDSFKALTTLNCSQLASLPALPSSLQVLTLSGIAVKTVVKGTLPSTLRSLTIADASNLNTTPEDLSIMTTLTELTLSSCNLSEFTYTANLQTLKTLSLQNNSLQTFSASLPFATTLELSGNRLRAFNTSNATQLAYLDLSDNELDQFPTAVLEMHGLKRLHLERNPLRGFQPTPDELAFLTKLAFLGMEQTQFSSDCATPTRLKQFTVCATYGLMGQPQPSTPGTDKANTTASNLKTKSSSGIIIALDIVLALGIVCAIVYITGRDRRERRARRRGEKEAIYAARSAEMSPSLVHLDVNTLTAFRLDKDEVFKSRRIGAGACGDVWLAIYGSQRVALKQLKHEQATPEAVQRFTQEAKLVSDLQHPNIVTFVGVLWTDIADLALVTVFASNGDLRGYLSKIERPSSGHWGETKLQIALEIAEALAYLHGLRRPVIHRDLQSRNVLLNDNLSPQVAGFDVASQGRSGAKKAMVGDALLARVGSVRWMAPELINGLHHDGSVDVFSLGVLLSELDTHDVPYASVEDETGQPIGDDVVKTRVANGTLRLTLTPTCPRTIAALALRCSAFEVKDRPRAVEVVHELRAFRTALDAEQADTDTSVSL